MRTEKRAEQQRKSARKCYDSEKEKDRKKQYREANPELVRSQYRANRERNIEKCRARLKLQNAIARGDIERGTCHCGALGEAHHEDYSKPLEVKWLCDKHHGKLSRK